MLDASAGVEIALQTPIGRRLQSRLPSQAVAWAPEHYYAETVAFFRREALQQRYDPARLQVALDSLLAAPLRRVSVRPLVPEAWALRHNLTIADALYVVVAQHLSAPLVTADLKLAGAPTLPVVTITP